MRIATRLALGLAALSIAVPGIASRPPCARADERPAFRVAFVGPVSGRLASSAEESLAGVRHAAAWRTSQGGVGGRKVEVLPPFDDGDDPAGAERAYAAAVAAKADGVVAAATGRTVEALVARARKNRTPVPLLLVGSAGPRPTVDARDPVLFVGPWPVDQACRLVDDLVLPCRSRRPALVVEDTPRGREMEAALLRNLGARAALGAVRVPPGAGPDPARDLAPLRDGGCDRLVLVGEPDLLDATRAALGTLSWDVPLLCAEGMLSRGSAAVREGQAASALFLVGAPTLVADGPPRPLYDAVEAAARGAGPIYPRTVAAWTATLLLCAGAQPPGPKPLKDAEVVAGLRDRRYGPEESKTTVFDETGRAALYRWTLWRGTAGGGEPMEEGYLPADGFGLLLGLRTPAAYRPEAGTKVVWVTFGDERSRPARTIDRDLAELGLATRGYEGSLDDRVRDEVMARALAKLNRLFLRNQDGTAVPGVSFGISFTPEKPAGSKPFDHWTVVVAGDDPDAGGRAFPGEARAEVYATFLRRTIFQKGALVPPVDHDDLDVLAGTRPWKGIKVEHLRADQVRCLLDGYAGSMALTGAHEIGHLAGLSHDETDPRSLMNVAEGAGLRETQAFFIPAHAAVLERVLGRAKEPARR